MKPPLVLIGTFNKILKYTEGIFLDLYHQFYLSLSNSEYLIISGYSFGDKGINYRIFEWLSNRIENKLIVIDPFVESLKVNSRDEGINSWGDWVNNNKIIKIPNGIESVGWEDIKKHLN